MKIVLSILLLISLSVPVIATADSAQPSGERQQQLRQMLHQNCSVCHGPALTGGIGPALTPKALAQKDEQLLVTTILEGRPGTAMMSWMSMLKEDEARWLVKFMRSGKK